MEQLRKLFYLSLILPILFIGTSCSSDDTTNPPETVNEAEVLVKYLESNGDFINMSAPAMIKASDVNANVLAGADQVVIDIRSATDYSAGHIQGAVNVALPDIVTYYESNNLQSKEAVVVACYTGQTAGYATAVLRLLGYNNVKDLKWGMCSWNEATAAKWTNGRSNAYASQFVTTDYPKNSAGDLPTLSTGKTEGADILKDRITTLLADDPFGSVKISAETVYSNLSNYYIVNYWSASDYSWGHIQGAVQYTPKADLKLDTFLKTLPTDKTIAVYCYTGQTSAHVAAFLKILGYDAKTILYGVNGMAYDSMPGTKFVPETDIHDYELVQ
ncbi:MAG: rhodanese-like domain-containing protein [Chlorobi bacterium]|nr:rhodanese-like domain-containing protein [Chlorobiota bacterium]